MKRIIFSLLIAGLCAPLFAQSDSVELITARETIPEELLLDVGIVLFDPGLPEYEHAEESDGVFPEVRRAEARYIPVRIMDTLQSTGFWGAVRVVPAEAITDLTITGLIQESSGLVLDMKVRVVDATGRVWLEERYRQKADERAYNERFESVMDPYASLYHRIANDLLKKYKKRKADDLLEIRRVGQLQFAEDLTPEAFDDYLVKDRKGRLEADRLPAEDDPMWNRIALLRERDQLFVDVFTQHYTTFYSKMHESYSEWRQFSYEELKTHKKLKRQARTRKILGAAAILGAILAADDADSSGAVTDAAIIGGVMAISSGMTKSQEAKMHKESMRELTGSLDTEVSPMLVDVEGELMRLSGSVEEQYAAWREILREIFAVETGAPVDVN